MGCWNGTCAISKLPIFAGDRVVSWFIVESQGYSRGDGSNFCYPHDKFQLMGMPFRAEYNDYGAVENVDPEDAEIVNLLIETLRHGLVEVEQGENEYHDIPVTKAALDFEVVMEAIHEGRLRVTGYKNDRAVGMIMVHESIFNKMIEDHSWQDYTWPDGYDGKAVKVTRKFDLDEFAKKVQEAVIEDTQANWRMWDKLERNFREVYGIKFIIGGLIDNQIPLDHDLFQKVFKGAAMTQVLTMMAYEMRFFFSPQSGAGSQQGEYGLYKSLIAAMQYTMQKHDDRWNEMYGDDDEEDEE